MIQYEVNKIEIPDYINKIRQELDNTTPEIPPIVVHSNMVGVGQFANGKDWTNTRARLVFQSCLKGWMDSAIRYGQANSGVHKDILNLFTKRSEEIVSRNDLIYSQKAGIYCERVTPEDIQIFSDLAQRFVDTK